MKLDPESEDALSRVTAGGAAAVLILAGLLALAKTALTF